MPWGVLKGWWDLRGAPGAYNQLPRRDVPLRESILSFLRVVVISGGRWAEPDRSTSAVSVVQRKFGQVQIVVVVLAEACFSFDKTGKPLVGLYCRHVGGLKKLLLPDRLRCKFY
jgi:hypothetical protein